MCNIKNIFQRFTTALLVVVLLFICAPSTIAANLSLEYHITGIDGKPLTNIQKRLKAVQKEIGVPLTQHKIRTIFAESVNHIKGALEPYGYFKPKIRAQLLSKGTTWRANYHINPGRAIRITAIEINLVGPGKNNPALKKFFRRIPSKILRKGDTFNTPKYERIKQRFFDIAQAQGYLKAHFSQHTIKISKKNYTAQIALTFNTGPRYYFGAVYFSKNPMSLNFLKRFLPFKMGTPYSTTKLLKLQSNLSQTPYFSHANVDPQLEQEKNHYVPIHVHLTPSKAKKYSIGLGFGTDTGARATAGFEWRRVTRTGHYLQTLIQVSQKNNNAFQVRYVIPGRNPVTDHYYITAGYFTNQPGDNNKKYTTTQLGISKVNVRYGWQRTLSLQYQHENFTENLKKESTNTILPSVTFERIRAHNRISTRNGYRNWIHIQAGTVSASNGSFLQLEYQGKYIQSFHKQNDRIILRTDLGITVVNNFLNMPLSQRFFAGGSQSIRGYDYQDLGPGRYLIVGSAEYQHRIHGNIYGALFYDMGNAFQNFNLHLKHSIGFGIVYRSVVGPIAITLAHPLDRNLEMTRHSLRIQFTMGPDL